MDLSAEAVGRLARELKIATRTMNDFRDKLDVLQEENDRYYEKGLKLKAELQSRDAVIEEVHAAMDAARVTAEHRLVEARRDVKLGSSLVTSRIVDKLTAKRTVAIATGTVRGWTAYVTAARSRDRGRRIAVRFLQLTLSRALLRQVEPLTLVPPRQIVLSVITSQALIDRVEARSTLTSTDFAALSCSESCIHMRTEPPLVAEVASGADLVRERAWSRVTSPAVAIAGALSTRAHHSPVVAVAPPTHARQMSSRLPARPTTTDRAVQLDPIPESPRVSASHMERTIEAMNAQVANLMVECRGLDDDLTAVNARLEESLVKRELQRGELVEFQESLEHQVREFAKLHAQESKQRALIKFMQEAYQQQRRLLLEAEAVKIQHQESPVPQGLSILRAGHYVRASSLGRVHRNEISPRQAIPTRRVKSAWRSRSFSPPKRNLADSPIGRTRIAMLPAVCLAWPTKPPRRRPRRLA